MKTLADIVVTAAGAAVQALAPRRAKPRRRFSRVVILLFPFFTLPVSAGDSQRPSLTGPEAVEARRLAGNSLEQYNLRLGPTAWTLSAAATLQANDNLRADSASSQADLIFRPSLETRMRLPLSQANTVNLNLSGGYAVYATHSEYNRPFITPGSELTFDLYAGPIWLDFHDRFAIVENPCLDPTVTGIADYERLDNTVGLSALWDLNRLIVELGYDHLNYVPLRDTTQIPGYTQPDGQSDAFSASLATPLSSVTLAGLETGTALLSYTEPRADSGFTDGVQANVGGLLETRLSEYIGLQAHAGYTAFHPESPGEDFSGFYAQLAATHRLNKFVEYTLGAGRVLNFGFYGGLLDQYFVTLEAQWHLIRKITLTSAFNFQHGTQLTQARETFDWFTVALSASRRLTEKLNARLGLQFYWRDSDLPARDYTVNVLTAALEYKF